MISAPSLAACLTSRAPFSTFSSVRSEKFIWMTAAFAFNAGSSLDGRCLLAERRDDLAAVALDHLLGVGDGGVDVVLGHAERREPAQLLDALLDCAVDGEAVDDLVGDVRGVIRALAG